MGLLADFFVASPEDASQYDSFVQNGNPIPADRFQSADYKNFTPLALGMLWAILRHEQWDARRHALEHVSHAEGGESWLFRFPDELVLRLADLDEADLHQIAEAWAHPREVPGNPDDLLPVLLDLKRLAMQARMHGRDLNLWGSL